MKKTTPITKSQHSFIGSWEQIENAFHTTTVVYNIAFANGRFAVSGVEEADGTSLEISNVKWREDRLYFTSVFPPTNHKAQHAMHLVSRRRATHRVKCRCEDGPLVVNEMWQRRLNSSKKLTKKRSTRQAASTRR